LKLGCESVAKKCCCGSWETGVKVGAPAFNTLTGKELKGFSPTLYWVAEINVAFI